MIPQKSLFLLAALLLASVANAQSLKSVNHLAKNKALSITYPYHQQFSGGASNALVDGLRGDPNNQSERWQAYQGDDLIAVIDLGEEQPIGEIRAGFLRNHEAQVFIPRTVTFEVSADGKKFKKVGSFEHFESMTRQGTFARDFAQPCKGVAARYVRIRAENVAFVPDWATNAGEQAWLYADEIMVSTAVMKEGRGMQGMWFANNGYEPEPLPEFDDVVDQLPVPIIEDSLLLAMYWYCWRTAFDNLRTPEPGSGFVANYMDESFSENLFQWDTHFMILYWKYAHHVFPAIRAHDNFYAHQHSSGYMCRELREADGTDFVFKEIDHTINPPLFGWVEWEWFKATGDPSRFEKIFPVLDHYGQWIDANRVFPNTPHLLYWNTNLGSGMDNSPRQGLAWVDMSTQMAMHYKTLSRMALYLQDEDRYLQLDDLYRRISSTINHFMWNEDDGLYYDLDPLNGHEKFKTAACFWPLIAGIPDSTKAERLVDNLLDSKQFLTKVPFPSLSVEHELYHPEGKYWRGGVWAPTNYMIIKGMHEAGFHARGALATEAYLDAMKTVYQKTGTVWENYAPEYIKQGNEAKGAFVGWSALGPISLLIESSIGIDIDVPVNTINWHIQRTDRHGVENLRWKESTVSLTCETKNGKATVYVDSETSFNLAVTYQGVTTMFFVEPGETEYELE